MADVLEILFRSFWTWFGGLLYLALFVGGFVGGLSAIFSRSIEIVQETTEENSTR